MNKLLLQNILKGAIKILNKDDDHKSKKIKASEEQIELIKKNPKILNKAYVAQKIYNAGFWFLIISIALILFISKFSENHYVYRMGSLLMTAIAIPVIISLAVISFERMSEIDDATIYNEKDTSTNTEEIKLLKNAIEELSKSNEALNKNLEAIKDELKQSNHKNKTHRKYR